jgi:hypothetical protein
MSEFGHVSDMPSINSPSLGVSQETGTSEDVSDASEPMDVPSLPAVELLVLSIDDALLVEGVSLFDDDGLSIVQLANGNNRHNKNVLALSEKIEFFIFVSPSLISLYRSLCERKEGRSR